MWTLMLMMQFALRFALFICSLHLLAIGLKQAHSACRLILNSLSRRFSFHRSNTSTKRVANLIRILLIRAVGNNNCAPPVSISILFNPVDTAMPKDCQHLILHFLSL